MILSAVVREVMDSVAPSPKEAAPTPAGALTTDNGLERLDSRMAEEQQDPLLKQVGRYELVRKIATGGMAELFLAKFSGPGGFEKRCALKRILPQFVEDDDFLRMFKNEARVAAMFEHPNLVQIFELGQDEDTKQFYIAMELINGMDLRQLQNLSREQGQQIPPELAAWMMSQALDGLAYAHEFKDQTGKPLNLVHRDVSPQNLLVSYEGALKVVDFGIVKASSNDGQTQTGMLKGKIAYMSPEQALGDPLDARSDLFAIGICLYELIAGVKPFRGPNEIMTLRAILEQEPPPITNFVPDCPRGIERAIYRALAKRRDDRYQSAREFQVDLASVLRGTPVPIDRHVFSEFMKTLTESGTDRFDTTKLKIPRIDTAALLEPTPIPMRFAGSAPSAPLLETSNPQIDQAMAYERSAATGNGAVASPLAQPMGAVAGVTAPGNMPAPDFADEQSIVAAAGLGHNRTPLYIAFVIFIAAMTGAFVWFFKDTGDVIVVSEVPARTVPAVNKPAPPATTPAPIATTPAPVVAAPIDKPTTETKPAADTKPATDTKPVVAAAPPVTKPVVTKPVVKKPVVKKPVVVSEPVVKAPPPPPAVPMGALSLTTSPKGLTVMLGSKTIGTTPLSAKAIPAGAHTLTLSKPRLGISRTLKVNITEGKTTTPEQITFQRGTLRVNSRPWSKVFVDGRDIGKTPLQVPIYEGRHTVKLVTEDGNEQVRTINIQPGAEEKVLVKF